MKQLNKNEPGFSAIEAVLVLAIVFLIGVVGYILYKNHYKTNSASTASATATTAKHTTSRSDKSTNSNASATALFKIPALGIEVTVPNSIKDMVYKVNSSSTLSTGQGVQSVTLSTQTLAKLDFDCSVDGSSPPLGTVSKTQGQYPANPDIDHNNVSGGLVKQFPTYYIAWSNPQGACGTAPSTQNRAIADTNLFSTALHSTVQPIK